MEKQPCVYILASGKNGTLYIGVTSNLIKRIGQHRNTVFPGFTKHYRVHELVWYEPHLNMESAISREKSLKHWNRSWKKRLISNSNPEWKDLYPSLLDPLLVAAGDDGLNGSPASGRGG
jgi:putative endonuclease